MDEPLSLAAIIPGLDWAADAMAVGRALREQAAKISNQYGLTTESIITTVLRNTATPVWTNGKVDDGRKALTYTFIRRMGSYI